MLARSSLIGSDCGRELAFVESVKIELGGRATHRGVEQKDGAYALRERNEAYHGDFGGKSAPLRLESTVVWNEKVAASDTSLLLAATNKNRSWRHFEL